MLPVVDNPAAQYVVEEGLLSGLRNIVFVTDKNKTTLENHFDNLQSFHTQALSKQKVSSLNSLSYIIHRATFTYVREREASGLGHALLTAQHSVGKEYIAVLLPDSIIMSSTPSLLPLIKTASTEKCSVIALQKVTHDQLSECDVIHPKKQFSPNLFQVKSIAKKPGSSAPSNLAIVGRYIFSPSIFTALEESASEKEGEIDIND